MRFFYFFAAVQRSDFAGSVQRGAFSTLGSTLLHLDLSDNELSHLEDGALLGMENLLVLNVSHNDLSRLNSDVFKGSLAVSCI